MRKTVVAIALLALAAPLRAQEYPSRPLQVFLPFPAGLVDILARGIAMTLETQLNQRVLVINRPGGAATLAMIALQQAPADGYSLNFTPVTPITIQTHRMKNLAFGRDAFTPVCQTFENRFFVATGPKSPFKDLAGLIASA